MKLWTNLRVTYNDMDQFIGLLKRLLID